MAVTITRFGATRARFDFDMLASGVAQTSILPAYLTDNLGAAPGGNEWSLEVTRVGASGPQAVVWNWEVVMLIPGGIPTLSVLMDKDGGNDGRVSLVVTRLHSIVY